MFKKVVFNCSQHVFFSVNRLDGMTREMPKEVQASLSGKSFAGDDAYKGRFQGQISLVKNPWFL